MCKTENWGKIQYNMNEKGRRQIWNLKFTLVSLKFRYFIHV